MRWERLFDDLEAQVQADQAAQLRADVADRTRSEAAEVTLAQRIRGSEQGGIEVLLSDGTRLQGTVEDVTQRYLILRDDAVTHLIAMPAIVSAALRSRQVGPPLSEVAQRLTLGRPLRELARDRSFVRICTTVGTFGGTVERVGADHLELAEHDQESRTRGTTRVILAFGHLLWVSWTSRPAEPFS